MQPEFVLKLELKQIADNKAGFRTLISSKAKNTAQHWKKLNKL